MKLLQPIITIVCLTAALITNAGEQPATDAKSVGNPATQAELQLLEGTWEGFAVDAKGTDKKPDSQETSQQKPGEIDLDFLPPPVPVVPPQPKEKVTITITGNSFHFHRDKDFWFDTTITLPADTNPKQLHATIKGGPPSQASSIGEVVVAIYKIEDGALILATGSGEGEAPKSFEATGDDGLRFELRKVQPQKKDTEPPKSE